MTGTAHQKALDSYIKHAHTSDDASTVAHAEAQIPAMTRSYGIELYCPQHRANHLFSAREVEELIASLTAAWSDAIIDREHAKRDPKDPVIWTSDEVLNQCPKGWLHDARDGEMYSEHIQGVVGARIESELQAS